MKKRLESNSAITLVALVVTIIVLIILAGVSISLVLGDNGIITKAKYAKENYQKGANEEQEELKNAENEIDEIIEEEEAGIAAKDIANATDKSEYYGATLEGYQCDKNASVNAWKILYADNENIYIIAENYISYQDCPPSATQTIHRNSTDYDVSFNEVIADYTGSSDITNSKIKKLNSDYFSKYSSENYNMKAIAYMLDTNIWNKFAGKDAEYAIGGPTLEMIINSYNDKYHTNYKAEASSNIGYHMSTDGGNTWRSYVDIMFNEEDSLYVIKETNLPEAMWIVSPSDYSENGEDMLYITCGGSLYRGAYSGSKKGIRPVVCLNSKVRIEKQKDGVYKIR